MSARPTWQQLERVASVTGIALALLALGLVGCYAYLALRVMSGLTASI
jgi:preprotein translocase subunit Sss1